MYCESSMQDFLSILTWKIHQTMALLDPLQMESLSANMTKGHGRQMHDWKVLVTYYKDTHFKLVAEKTRYNGHMGSDRQQGDVTFSDCGATSVEFVAQKKTIQEGSDCCGE